MLLQLVQLVMLKKGGKLFEVSGMKLFNKPYRPTVDDLHKNGRNFPSKFFT